MQVKCSSALIHHTYCPSSKFLNVITAVSCSFSCSSSSHFLLSSPFFAHIMSVVCVCVCSVGLSLVFSCSPSSIKMICIMLSHSMSFSCVVFAYFSSSSSSSSAPSLVSRRVAACKEICAVWCMLYLPIYTNALHTE